MISRSYFKFLLVFLIILSVIKTADAREIHVALTGSYSASGTADDPLSSIDRAAVIAQPGDVVIIHGGTYRELISPRRGGTSEDKRITYKAAPGEKVIVKGSERITNWEPVGFDVWKAELPYSFFGDYNPYYLKIKGRWMSYGFWHHRGDVYLNGEAFYERETREEVRQGNGNSWYCEVVNGKTTIWVHFGDGAIDPNKELVEINVRQNILFPDVSGLQYITIDGIQFMHSAENWQPPRVKLQSGAIGTRMGKHWIIENCTIVNARCVGISLGTAPGVGLLKYDDAVLTRSVGTSLGTVPGAERDNIDDFGHHIIRNNVIRRCGQAGIAGSSGGASRCEIINNLIEDTNYRREFGGWETAGIKFHQATDTFIGGNLIRGVYTWAKKGAFGIWIDFGNQGTWISKNIIYNTDAAAIFLEMNHGPMLVDNNILIGQAVRSNSEAQVFAHNLFVDNGFWYTPDTTRRSGYYQPHTLKLAGSKTGTARDDRWYNNIFVRQGLDDVEPASGYESDCNVFLEGAKKSTFGDKNSKIDSHITGFAIKNDPLGAIITFNMNNAPFGIKCPVVDSKLVGVFPTVGQTIEDREGSKITVNTDINGRKFTNPVPGPLSDLKQGVNTVTWSYKKSR